MEEGLEETKTIVILNFLDRTKKGSENTNAKWVLWDWKTSTIYRKTYGLNSMFEIRITKNND